MARGECLESVARCFPFVRVRIYRPAAITRGNRSSKGNRGKELRGGERRGESKLKQK